MRQAKRIYSKAKHPYQPQPSFIFTSKIDRHLPNQSRRTSIGPGQYEVSLPLVKPKFEAIRKNVNTIIIKINQKLSPVFQSLSPRFKQDSKNKTEKQQSLHRKKSRSEIAENQNLNEGIKRKEKLSLEMKKRLQKLSEMVKNNLFQEENQSLKLNKNQDALNNQVSNDILNSVYLYKKQKQRIHFLLKHMKTNNKTKGSEWSRYKQEKGISFGESQVPGPGAYSTLDAYGTRRQRSIDDDLNQSWQFRSITKRNSFFKANTPEKQDEKPSSEVNQVQSIELIRTNLDQNTEINMNRYSIHSKLASPSMNSFHKSPPKQPFSISLTHSIESQVQIELPNQIKNQEIVDM